MKRVLIGLLVSHDYVGNDGYCGSGTNGVNTMCAGYTVDVTQDPNGYDMLLTVPLPPSGISGRASGS